MLRRDRIEARAALLTEPARSRVRDALDVLDKTGLFKADQVADLARERPALQTVAIELAVYAAEWRLGGAAAIRGPEQLSMPGGRSLWWGWSVAVWPEGVATNLSLAERSRGFDLHWRPESDDARHSEAMKDAIGILVRELAAWLGRPVRLLEVFV